VPGVLKRWGTCFTQRCTVETGAISDPGTLPVCWLPAMGDHSEPAQPARVGRAQGLCARDVTPLK
jgi:hypothetical protein